MLSVTSGALPSNSATVQPSWLRRVPVPIFGTAMGIIGVALCGHLLHELLGMPSIVGDTILTIGITAFLAAAVVYVAKALRHPDAVWAEWRDPAQAPFFGQVAVILLLLAEAGETHAAVLATCLFAVGTILAALLTVALLMRWFRGVGGILAANIGPSWAIPGIALLMISALAPRMASAEIGQLFAGISFVYFFVIGPHLVGRLGTGEPLPERLRPTVTILVAVPSVALLALDGLTDGRWAIEAPYAGAALMGAAALLGLIMIMILPSLIITVPFGLSWWAYSMPPAALALASLVYGHATGGGARLIPGATLAALIIFGTALLATKTLAAIATGRFLPPP